MKGMAASRKQLKMGIRSKSNHLSANLHIPLIFFPNEKTKWNAIAPQQLPLRRLPTRAKQLQRPRNLMRLIHPPLRHNRRKPRMRLQRRKQRLGIPSLKKRTEMPLDFQSHLAVMPSTPLTLPGRCKTRRRRHNHPRGKKLRKPQRQHQRNPASHRIPSQKRPASSSFRFCQKPSHHRCHRINRIRKKSIRPGILANNAQTMARQIHQHRHKTVRESRSNIQPLLTRPQKPMQQHQRRQRTVVTSQHRKLPDRNPPQSHSPNPVNWPCTRNNSRSRP